MNKDYTIGALLICAFSLCSPVGEISAQVQTSGPLVKFPEGPAHWVVSIEQDKTEKPERKSRRREEEVPEEMQTHMTPSVTEEQYIPKILKKVEVTQTTNMSRSVLTWEGGKSTEFWVINSPKIVMREDQNGRVTMEGDETFFVDALPNRLLFYWLKEEYKVGEIKVNGRDCADYRKSTPRLWDMVGPAGSLPKTPIPLNQRALIDIETRYPVALDTGEKRYRFEYIEGEIAPLVMPERFQKEFEYAMAAEQKPQFKGRPRSWQTTKR